MIPEILEKQLYSYSNITFEPTINIFKNAILFNYKKIGTRFFRELLVYPNSIWETNRQLDIQFNRISLTDNLNSPNNLKLRYKTYYITTPWDMDVDNHKEYMDSLKWDSTESFLNDMEVDSFTELLLENTKKDIIFLIRNPLERFFSGIIQVMQADLEILQESAHHRNIFKTLTDITDDGIRNLIKHYNVDVLDENLNIENLKKYFKYILEYRFDKIYEDIHTEPYLQGYKELIYNIKDDSRIKIVNLDDCNNSQSSIDFFTNLDDNPNLEEFFKSKNFITKQSSNKFASSFLVEMYNNEEFKTPSVYHYLKREYAEYLNLMSSKYFVKI
jgi:hypothetical protein